MEEKQSILTSQLRLNHELVEVSLQHPGCPMWSASSPLVGRREPGTLTTNPPDQTAGAGLAFCASESSPPGSTDCICFATVGTNDP
ncbi:hypothetical protein CRUP_027020, partial [Coryphaenoides rupestris]